MSVTALSQVDGDELARKSLGLNPKQFRRGLELCGDELSLRARYESWKNDVLVSARDACLESLMSGMDLARVLGDNYNHVFVLKSRGLLSWTERDGNEYRFSVEDVESLFQLNETILLDEGHVTTATKGVLSHLYLAYLERDRV